MAIDQLTEQGTPRPTRGVVARAMLDALEAHVCLVDSTGTIVAVNEAWRSFALANGGGDLPTAEGADYLRVCERADPDVAPEAAAVARALRAALAGEHPELELEYPCDAPDEPRWFVTRVVPVEDVEAPMAFVSHTDVTARRLTEKRLRESLSVIRATANARRRLFEKLLVTEEAERRRIAGEIHDDPVQSATAISLRLGVLRQHVTTPEGIRVLDQLERTVTSTIARLRSLMFELHPPTLGRDGLGMTLDSYLEHVAAETGIEYEIHDELRRPIPAAVSTLAFRIAQEAIVNTRKHAQASRIDVHLGEDDDGSLRVRISDDGVGFDPSRELRSRPGHLGLGEMLEHAELANGWLQVDSAVGRGSTVTFSIENVESSGERDAG